MCKFNIFVPGIWGIDPSDILLLSYVASVCLIAVVKCEAVL